MTEPLSRTTSLCPYCLRRISAQRITENDAVYLEKQCPEHGDLPKTILWRNDSVPYDAWKKSRAVIRGPRQFMTDSVHGCPYDCGICPSHKQDTCTAIIELTYRCNISCSICFASANTTPQPDPDYDQIIQILSELRDYGSPVPIQLSGGEPTLRDDLPQIVASAREMGFDHIQVNTNGIRLAEDIRYGEALKEAGVTVFFLQFDGITADVYRNLRGTDLLPIKLKAIQRCSELKIGVILVPTLVRSINFGEIGAVIHFAKEWIPTVKGVHFQPMAYLGRYPNAPQNKDRVLLTDILKAIEDQTAGELKIENLIPPGCEEPHCSFSSLSVLSEDGVLAPTTHFGPVPFQRGPFNTDSAEKSRKFVRQHWKYREPDQENVQKQCCSPGTCCDPFQAIDGFERILSHSLCISGMAFQDAWNIDLERLQRCCVQVARPGKKLIPFCAYYVTNANGCRISGMARQASQAT
jgi:7,8-dihydro-6-hydroxymethylpterin dimethyltransferase